MSVRSSRFGACLCGVLLLVCCLCPSARAWEATVVSVKDGDSLVLRNVQSKKIVTVRLFGIDCPEFGGRDRPTQPYARKAAALTRELTHGVRLAVTDRGKDAYGRTLAGMVRLPDGRVLQEELLKAGLAWVYTRYCQDCAHWKALEREARDSRRGLWRDEKPVPPWDWRQGRLVPSRKNHLE